MQKVIMSILIKAGAGELDKKATGKIEMEEAITHKWIGRALKQTQRPMQSSPAAHTHTHTRVLFYIFFPHSKFSSHSS